MNLRHAKLLVTVLTLACAAAVAAVAAFLFVPTFREVVRLSGEIAMARAELAAQYANRRNLLASLGEAETARIQMRHLAGQFVPPGRELDFITSIESLAARTGVEEHVQLSAIEGAKAAPELRENYELTLNGPYRNVMQMLVELEKMPVLLLADGFTLRPGAGPTPQDPSFLSVLMHGALSGPPKGL